eukprot:8202383-Pyramimonas_sp.AAC.1
MEASVEIRGEEITARKRATEAAFRDGQPAKKAANPSTGDINSWKERPTFRCFPDKLREWSRLVPTGEAKCALKKGWGWRYTMRRHDILHMRSDEVVTALKADLDATSQTIFQHVYSQFSQVPWA